MAVTWEESRPRTRKYGNRGAWTEEAGELRAHPGREGVIAVFPEDSGKRPYGLAGHVRNGGYAAFQPRGEFDAWVQTEDDGTRKVFARYVGPDRDHGLAEIRTAAAGPVSVPVIEQAETVTADTTPPPATTADGGAPGGTLASVEAIEAVRAKLGRAAGSGPARPVRKTRTVAHRAD